MNKNPKLHKYYDSSDPNLKTLRFRKRRNDNRNQKIALRVGVVVLFFLVEVAVMWVAADSLVSYSPLQSELVLGAKLSKRVGTLDKLSDKLTPPPVIGVSDMYLVIPRLLVNAPIDPVTTTANGDMASSQSMQRVGWYKDGTKPGEVGSVVLGGHYGNPDESGVFRSIDKLKQGDRIEVRNKSGQSLTYKVYKTSTFKQSEVPLQELFNKNDGMYLNLVTCVGNWDAQTSSLDHRLIVYSKLDSY